jgi:hypothetical protein
MSRSYLVELKKCLLQIDKCSDVSVDGHFVKFTDESGFVIAMLKQTAIVEICVMSQLTGAKNGYNVVANWENDK